LLNHQQKMIIGNGIWKNYKIIYFPRDKLTISFSQRKHNNIIWTICRGEMNYFECSKIIRFPRDKLYKIINSFCQGKHENIFWAVCRGENELFYNNLQIPRKRWSLVTECPQPWCFSISKYLSFGDSTRGPRGLISDFREINFSNAFWTFLETSRFSSQLISGSREIQSRGSRGRSTVPRIPCLIPLRHGCKRNLSNSIMYDSDLWKKNF